MARKKIDGKELLKYLTPGDKEKLLLELLEAVNESVDKGSFEPIDRCLDDWEDEVEFLSIPGMTESVMKRFEELKAQGRIN